MIILKNKKAIDPNARKAFEEVKLEIAADFGIAEDINIGNVTKRKKSKPVDKQFNTKK